MKHKKPNKKPPTGGTGGGEGENELGRDVFYPQYSTKPVNCQIDYAKYADVMTLHAEIYRLQAKAARKAARLLEIIAEGGTIYPL